MDALRGINPHKATEFDGPSPRMLKPMLKQVIQESEWPKEWKRGEWVPVYKKEVTLLPAVDKIFEQLLCYQLRDKFETIFDNSMSSGILTRAHAIEYLPE